MSGRKLRVSGLEFASALAGAAFFGVTTFFAIGTAVWAILSIVGASLPVIGVGEAAAGLACLALTIVIARRALALAATESAA
ncbi:MAG: hypothetical protein ABL308_14450 [Oceanicaulis sp.]